MFDEAEQSLSQYPSLGMCVYYVLCYWSATGLAKQRDYTKATGPQGGLATLAMALSMRLAEPPHPPPRAQGLA